MYNENECRVCEPQLVLPHAWLIWKNTIRRSN